MARPEQIETRDRFLVFDTLTTRWKDNDNWGHVNNAVYNSWIDTAITSHLWSILPDFGASQIIPVAAETRVICVVHVVRRSRTHAASDPDGAGSGAHRR